MSEILQRRQTHFVLWCPRETNPPVLILGRLKPGNPARFKQLLRLPLQPASQQGLWELAAASCELREAAVYHYWFEVDNSHPEPPRIQVTDPLAFTVDYRVFAPANPTPPHPAAVIAWVKGKLVAADPHGESGKPQIASFQKLASNDRLVIYELPATWVRTSGSEGFERGIGTFRDARSLVKKKIKGTNFLPVRVAGSDKPYLVELGINALELLPPADSIYAREWGYGTSHYLAPDYELGYPEGHLSPTSNQDLTDLVNSCHKKGIRVILDVVLGFMKEEPYRYIDFHNFYLEYPEQHPDDPNAYSSRDKQGGGKEFRNSFSASCPRYVASVHTYDPISGEVKTISPIRQHMLTVLARWMRDFQVDGFRLDSVENVANWDFIQEFKNAAYSHFGERYADQGAGAGTKFLVVGEELSLPRQLLQQGRLDGLWNEHFQTFIRAALLGENAGSEHNFEQTVHQGINCRLLGLKGSQAINYLTSHDVEGHRKERLYNLMQAVITLENSSFLFNRQQIESLVIQEILAAGRPVDAGEVSARTDARILHQASLRRIKLGFVCLLTAVGTPMILAGEEFADQHDLFDNAGRVSHPGGKQVDPLNFSRLEDPDRQDLFWYVARLVKLRTTHPGLAGEDIGFIHSDFTEGKRVVVWKRGAGTDSLVVVANFSDYTTPFALEPHATYVVPNWPATPANHQWEEVTRSRIVEKGKENKEPVFAWEAKVYRLVSEGAG